MKSHSIEGQTLLVTGAGKGLGKAFVESLLSRPREDLKALKLCLTSRTASDLEGLKTLAETKGVETLAIASDIASNPTQAITASLAKFGRIHSLIHCAGVGRFGDFLDLTPEDLQYTLSTNVEGTFLLLQKVYEHMKSQPPEDGLRGQIQVITSVAAERPFPQSALYCMSKYAQRGLLEVMRGYGYQDAIRILEVRSGAALTPMWGEVAAEQKARMMQAEDVATPMVQALFLPSRASIEIITIRPVHGDI